MKSHNCAEAHSLLLALCKYIRSSKFPVYGAFQITVLDRKFKETDIQSIYAQEAVLVFIFWAKVSEN
jgi:hypothetical protein